MADCTHKEVKEMNVALIAGFLIRAMTVCKDCGKVIKVREYEVD